MSIVTISKILNRYGNYEDLPTLSTGELGLAADVDRLFIGNKGNNLEILTTNSDLTGTPSSYTFLNQDAGYNVQTGILTNDFNAIAYSNGIYVAVANNGLIYTSPDGYNWTSRISGVSANLTAVCAGIVYRIINGTNTTFNGFVAGGANGNILTSIDGMTWQSSLLGVTASITDICFGNNLFILTLDNGYICSSIGAQSWQLTSVVVSSLTSVTYGNSLWVVAGINGQSAHSTDAHTWVVNNQLVIGSNALTFNSLTYSNDAFIASAQGQMLLSVDGANWALTFIDSLHSIAYGDLKYVIVGDSGTVMTSVDTNAWTTVSIGANNLRNIIYDGSQFLAVGDNGSIVTSPDGVNWTNRTSGTSVSLTGIAFHGSLYIAVGLTGEASYSTNSGVTWTPTASSTSYDLESITVFGGVFYASGRNGTITKTTNGTTWTSVTTGLDSNLWSISASSTKIVAVGDSGSIITSTNGTTWTQPVSGTTVPLFGISAMDGNYFAVGIGGNIITSSDGITWSLQTQVTQTSLIGAFNVNNKNISLGNNKTVVVNNSGNWSVINGVSLVSPMIQYYSMIPYGSEIIAVGQNGIAMTSNFVNWKSFTLGGVSELKGITVNGSQLVAVGINGQYINSVNGLNWTIQSVIGNSAATRRSWQQKFDDYVSIKDFGVHADGSDCGNQINQALQQIYCTSFAPNARKVILFPGGTYSTSVPILLPSNAIIRGEGINNTIIKSTQTSNLPVFYTADSLQQYGSQAGLNGASLPSNISIDSMTISGLADGIVVGRSSAVRLFNISFQGGVSNPIVELNSNGYSTSGIVLLGVTFAPTQRVVINNCQFSGFTSGISSEMNINVVNDININNNYFYNLYRGISIGYVSGSADNVKITSNVFDNIFNEGVRANSSTNIVTSDNSFKEVGNNLLGVSNPQTSVIVFGSTTTQCSSLYDEFVRPSSSSIPKIQSNGNNSKWDLSGTLAFGYRAWTIGKSVQAADNATTAINTFPVSQNNCVLEYVISRGIDSRVGTVTIALTTGNVATVQDNGTQTNSVGSTWTAAVSGGIVTINLTLTSTGTPASVLSSMRFFSSNA